MEPTSDRKLAPNTAPHPTWIWWGRRVAAGGMLITLIGTMVLGINHRSSAPELRFFDYVRTTGLLVMFGGLLTILAAYPRKIPAWIVNLFGRLDIDTSRLWLNALKTAGLLFFVALLTLLISVIFPPITVFANVSLLVYLAVGLCAVRPRDRYYLVAAIIPYGLAGLVGIQKFVLELAGFPLNFAQFPGWMPVANSIEMGLCSTLLATPLLALFGVLAGLWFERQNRD